MRELKLNPHLVVERVLATGEPAEVLSHGRPTGVVLAPAAPLRRESVKGSVLKAALGPPDPVEAEDMRRIIAQAREAQGLVGDQAEGWL
jgi:PHD/YefM family antitoxin component YafN of YafNO toxin-antitoxin module